MANKREGTKYGEFWEEGEAYTKLNIKIKDIQHQREEIEKLKRHRNKNK